MSADDYATTESLRLAAWEAAELYELSGDLQYLATERALRGEIDRRIAAGECERCGYAGAECLCTGCRDRDVVLLAELETEGAA